MTGEDYNLKKYKTTTTRNIGITKTTDSCYYANETRAKPNARAFVVDV